MPEHEFDFYLSLLGRFLGLRPDQREQIAAELRDHLEERLEELMRRGRSREEAVRSALEEFGDAAGLAASFTRVANFNRRRTIMRCTAGVMGAAAAAVALAFLMWPDEARLRGPAGAVAQQGSGVVPGGGDAGGSGEGLAGELTKQDGDSDREATVEAALGKRLKSLDLTELPFQEALDFLSDQIGIDILIDKAHFQENGLANDAPVTLKIKHASVKAQTALELLLEQIGGKSLGYTIRDGVIYISEKYDAAEIQVYNCRDLMEGFQQAQPAAMGAMMPGGEGGFGGASGMPGGAGLGGGMPGGGLGEGGMGMGIGAFRSPAGSALVQVILTTIHPDTWTQMGGQGSVEEFHGLLIVKHSQTVHREVRQLLTMMRQAAQEKPGTGTGRSR